MKLQCSVMSENGKSLCRGIMGKGLLCTIFLTIVLLCALTSYAAETFELPDELKNIQITDEFIKSPNTRVGFISVMKGDGKLIIVREPYNKGFFADLNDSVYEKDILYTLSDCQCRLTFFDDNEIVMAADSHLEIKEMYTDIFKGEKRTIFGMSKGKVVFLIRKLFQFRNAMVQLDTPTSAIGVRGTTFGVEVKKGRGRVDMLNRMVASTSLQQLALGPSPTNSLETNLYVLAGIVSCACQINNAIAILSKNQFVVCGAMGLGEVITDPAVVAAFVNGILGGMDPGSESDPASSGSGGAGGCSP